MARVKSVKNDQIYLPVDPVLRVPDKAIDDMYLVERAMRKFEEFSADRVDWLRRREEYYLGWDDYLSPVYKGLWDGSSNVHLPKTEIQCNAMHARFLQAIFFVNPPFYIDPQEDLDEYRIKLIERKMKYILMRYANYYKGVFNVMDDFCWDLVTGGMGILSRDWRIEQRRFLKIDENPDFLGGGFDLKRAFQDDIDEDEFKVMVDDAMNTPYEEKMVIRTVFNGPILQAEDPTFILFKGRVADSTNLNLHETVMKICYFSENDLIKFKQSQYMDEDAVDKVIGTPGDVFGASVASSRGSSLYTAQDIATGVRTIHSNNSNTEKMYEMLCVYDTVSLAGASKYKNPQLEDNINVKRRVSFDRLADKLVYIVHVPTQTLMRWTYLDRISANGKLPLHMCHLYRRPRSSIGRGLVETQRPLNEMSDILINQSIDAGMLANNPMFGYRGSSTFDPEEIRVEPGLGVKLDDVNNDLRFFSWNVNPTWSVPVIGLLDSMMNQLTSMGPESSGQVGSRVGPLRSNAGLKTMFAERDVQLDVLMRRLNDCLSEVYEGLYYDCEARMPDQIKIPVIGMDGIPELDDEGKVIMQDIKRDEKAARVHFGLYANATNMNRQAQLEASMTMAQFLFQRVALETGIVGPNQVYEILNDVLKNMGKSRIDKFIKKPEGADAITFEAEVYCCAQGIAPPVVLADREHAEKIAKYDELLGSDQAQMEVQYGQVHPSAIALMKSARMKHEKYLMTLEKASNMENPTGMIQSPTMDLQGGQSPGQETPQGAPNRESQPQGAAPTGAENEV